MALISSMVISATSFSGVSEIAMVPESELRMPTLMVSAACALQPPKADSGGGQRKSFDKTTTLHSSNS